MNSSSSVLFGRGSLPVALPAFYQATVIEKPRMPILPDPVEAVTEALASPVGSRPLAELAKEAHSVCILICDITRPVPNGLILPPLIETLLAAGIAADHITVLVATGLHHPNVGPQLRELVGSDWVLATVRVVNHEAEEDAAHVEIGTTTRGTLVRLDRRLVEADLKIATGLVEPHFMAGYSGGRKVIAPGVAHATTIRTFHNTRFMEDGGARNCNLDNNPLNEEQHEILGMLGTAYSVNTCLDPERQLAFVNFGEIAASHREAVAFIRRYAEVAMPRWYRCVIASAAGYPLDQSYYQTVKGMVAPLGLLEKGGSLLIAAECAAGLGSEGFRQAQSSLIDQGIEGFLRAARSRSLASTDEWQTVKLIEALRDYRVHLYAPALNMEERRLTAVTCHNKWTEAVTTVLEEAGSREVAVVPEGPYVIPYCNASSVRPLAQRASA